MRALRRYGLPLALAGGLACVAAQAQAHASSPHISVVLSGPLTGVHVERQYTYRMTVIAPKTYRHVLINFRVLALGGGSNVGSHDLHKTNLFAHRPWAASYYMYFQWAPASKMDELELAILQPSKKSGRLRTLFAKRYPVSTLPGEPNHGGISPSNPLLGS